MDQKSIRLSGVEEKESISLSCHESTTSTKYPRLDVKYQAL